MTVLRALYAGLAIANAVFVVVIGSALAYLVARQSRIAEGYAIVGAVYVLYIVHVACLTHFEIFDRKFISWWPVPEALFGRSPFWLRFISQFVLCVLLGGLLSLFLPTDGGLQFGDM